MVYIVTPFHVGPASVPAAASAASFSTYFAVRYISKKMLKYWRHHKVK